MAGELSAYVTLVVCAASAATMTSRVALGRSGDTRHFPLVSDMACYGGEGDSRSFPLDYAGDVRQAASLGDHLGE